MASTLKQILAFTNVASGATATLAHGLNIDDVGVIPDVVERDNPSFEIVSVDATDVEVRNNGALGSCNVLVEFWHTIERVFGQGNRSFADQLSPAPFLPGGASGSPTNGQVMTYRDDGQELEVFVDQVNGDDANDGLTAGTALQTLEAIRQKFQLYLYGAPSGATRFVVNLLNPTNAQITYTVRDLHVGGRNSSGVYTWNYRGPDMIQATLATGPATAALDAVPAQRVDQTGTPSGTGNRTQLDFSTAAPGWTVNDLRGRFLRVTRGGTLVYYELPICENGVDFLIVDTLGIVGTLQNTDTVEIVEPAVKIEAPAGAPDFGAVAISGPGCAATPAFFFATDPCTFERIAFADILATEVSGLTFDRCLVTGENNFGFRIFGGSAGYVNTICNAVLLHACASVAVTRSRATGAADPIEQPANTNDPTLSMTILVHDFNIRVGFAEPFGFNPRYNGQFGGFKWPVSVYASGESGILVDGPGSFLTVDTTATPSINGDGNTDVGLRCVRGGRAIIQGGALTTITGAGGDLQVDNGAAISYGTGVGQFEEAAGFNGIFHRMLSGTAAAPTGDTSIITTRSIIP